MTVTAIKQEIIDLSNLLKKEITLDVKTGVAVITPDTYERLLPTGITKEHVESIQQYNTDMAAAAVLTIGELSNPAMKKHKDLDRVHLSMPMVGKDMMNVSYDRSRQVPSRGEDGVAGIKTMFGAASVSIDMYATGPRGELKKIKTMLKEQAFEAFGK